MTVVAWLASVSGPGLESGLRLEPESERGPEFGLELEPEPGPALESEPGPALEFVPGPVRAQAPQAKAEVDPAEVDPAMERPATAGPTATAGPRLLAGLSRSMQSTDHGDGAGRNQKQFFS